MEEVQEHKDGWCKFEKKMKTFVSTVSPKGFWVCTTCSFKTEKLLKPPVVPQTYSQLNNHGGL